MSPLRRFILPLARSMTSGAGRRHQLIPKSWVPSAQVMGPFHFMPGARLFPPHLTIHQRLFSCNGKSVSHTSTLSKKQIDSVKSLSETISNSEEDFKMFQNIIILICGVVLGTVVTFSDGFVLLANDQSEGKVKLGKAHKELEKARNEEKLLNNEISELNKIISGLVTKAEELQISKSSPKSSVEGCQGDSEASVEAGKKGGIAGKKGIIAGEVNDGNQK